MKTKLVLRDKYGTSELLLGGTINDALAAAVREVRDTIECGITDFSAEVETSDGHIYTFVPSIDGGAFVRVTTLATIDELFADSTEGVL